MAAAVRVLPDRDYAEGSGRSLRRPKRTYPCGEAVENERAVRPSLLRDPPSLHAIAWLLDQEVGWIPIRSRHHLGMRPR